MIFLKLAALSGFTAVALGAFGAHLLRGKVAATLYNAFQTGVQYHALHSVLLLLIGLLLLHRPSTWLRASGWLICCGILLFSGSLYLLAISGLRPLGAITPFGGLALLAGWLSLFIGVSRWSDPGQASDD